MDENRTRHFYGRDIWAKFSAITRRDSCNKKITPMNEAKRDFFLEMEMDENGARHLYGRDVYNKTSTLTFSAIAWHFISNTTSKKHT